VAAPQPVVSPPAEHGHGHAPASASPREVARDAKGLAVFPFGRLATESMGGGKSGLPVDALLSDLAKRKSGDLHLTIGEPPSFRKDGDIERMDGYPVIDATQMETYLLPIMPPLNRQEFAETNDTDFAYQAPDGNRFRVNIYRDRNGVACAMRLIPSDIPTAEKLGLPKVLLNLATLPKGLVLVTGPTGSGKSTTLAAMVNFVNLTRKVHLLTVEDPVEFVYTPAKALIHQREVRLHTGSFSRALRAALRENPDIVLIGEMRDLETTKIAIEVAETGHLVFGTLHTNTAIGTVDRIVDQFPADQQEQVRMMLASSLKGVVAQALVRRIGGGRAAALEILVVNEAVQAMIREKKTHMLWNHMQTQKQDGNQLLNEALFNMVSGGVATAADAYSKAVNRKELMEMFKTRGVDVTEIEAALADPNAKKK
jgi:twitching motility protein PilT